MSEQQQIPQNLIDLKRAMSAADEFYCALGKMPYPERSRDMVGRDLARRKALNDCVDAKLAYDAALDEYLATQKQLQQEAVS